MSRQRRKKLLSVLVASLIRRRQRRRAKKLHVSKPRSTWIKPWLKKRPQLGVYDNLLEELKNEDPNAFTNFLRIDCRAFEELLELVSPKLLKQDTRYRAAISPGERLAITLRYLATGESFQSLSYQFRVGRSTICNIVPETCEIIYQVLHEQYMKMPSSETEWETIAKSFDERWNFPLCLGALDGKHVSIVPPKNSGSTYYNYKHHFSIVLMALVDADYQFRYVDIGCNGRISDGGVFNNSSLGKAMGRSEVSFPSPVKLPGMTDELPYTIVADDAFQLRENIMKPYPHRSVNEEERIYNYRLSRARRVVENAFGILSNRFRVFHTVINLPPKTVEKVVLASCVLHNYLRSHSTARHVYTPPGSLDAETGNRHVVPGSWRVQTTTMVPLAQNAKNHSMSAKKIRDSWCKYFNSSDGSVPWQKDMV